MGLAIFLKDEARQLRSKRYPLKVKWRFVCDGDHAFVDPPEAEFNTGKVFAYAEAMRAGWKEARADNSARLFFCPDCSGKVKQETGD